MRRLYNTFVAKRYIPSIYFRIGAMGISDLMTIEEW